MRTALLAVALLLSSCGDDKPADDKTIPGPPAFAPDRAAVDQAIDGGAPDAH